MSATEEILELLTSSSKPLGTTGIVEETGLSYSTVILSLKVLVESEKVGRFKGHANSWLYTTDLTSIKDKADEVKKKPLSPNKGISSKELGKFLKTMTKGNWVHPLYKEQRTLNRTVLDVFDLAYQKATGSDVEDSDLLAERSQLEYLVTKHQQYLDILTSILRQGYLWDAETFATFLTEDYTAEEIRSMVREAREYN